MGMTLADVKLPLSSKEQTIEKQVKRLGLLADNLSNSNSKSLSILGELLEQIANELNSAIERDSGDFTVSEEIEKAVRLARDV